MAENCPKLQKLNLSRCDNINYEKILPITIKTCKNLKSITLGVKENLFSKTFNEQEIKELRAEMQEERPSSSSELSTASAFGRESQR